MKVALILTFLLLIALTFVLYFLESRTSFGKKIGAITLAYIIGIVLGNIFPSAVPAQLAEPVYQASVALSIPAILFSASLITLFKTGKKMLLPFLFAILGAIAGATVLYLFSDKTVLAIQYSAMLCGVYIGGTPNLGAIGTALDAPETTFVLLNAGDMFFSGLYLLMLLSVGPRIISWILPDKAEENTETHIADARPTLKSTLVTVVLSILTLVFAYGIVAGFVGSLNIPVLFLAATVLSLVIASSSLQKFTRGSYYVGYWFLILFALSLGSQTQLNRIYHEAAAVLPLVGIVISITLLVTYTLAYIFKTDRHYAVLASVAAVFGPPFIAPVAYKFNKPGLIVAGISCGLLGYALGNIIGLGLAYLLGFH